MNSDTLALLVCALIVMFMGVYSAHVDGIEDEE